MSSEEAGKLAEKLLAPLQGQLSAQDQQIKALTEAITALSKTVGPAARLHAALQALRQGDMSKAQAIFAEVVHSKEAEARQACKEAAAAARHLCALAFMNNPKEALAACQKAVLFDPDNADSRNMLTALILRGGVVPPEEAALMMLALKSARR